MYRYILILAILSGCGAADENKSGASQPLFSVSFLTVQKTHFEESFVSSGDIIPFEAVDIQSEVSAKITGIHFEEGAQVKKGQLLISLNDSELKAQLKSVSARYELARKEADTRKALLEVKGISQEEYDVAQAQALQLEGEKEFLQAQLERYQIRAPFNGRVGLRMYSLGALVSPDNTLTQLVEDYPVKMEFQLPERFFAEVQVGDTVRVNLKGKAKTKIAVVYAKEPRINETTRSFRVRAINNDRNERDLTPGKFIEVAVQVRRSEEALMIPTDAIVPMMGAQRIYLYKNGKAEAKEVIPGYRSGELIEILEGLNAGDTLITSGLLTLRPGAPVQLRNKKPTEEAQ